MNSLKQKLQTALRLRGYMTTSEIYEMCRVEGYKLSNAERRLRELIHETPEIEFDRDSKGVIHGYKWSETQNLPLERTFTPKVEHYCCGNRLKGLSEHSRDCKFCKPKEEKVSNALF